MFFFILSFPLLLCLYILCPLCPSVFCSSVTLSLHSQPFMSIMSFCLLFPCYPVFYYFCPFCHYVFYSLVFVLLCFFCLYLSFCLKMIIFAVSMYNALYIKLCSNNLYYSYKTKCHQNESKEKRIYIY